MLRTDRSRVTRQIRKRILTRPARVGNNRLRQTLRSPGEHRRDTGGAQRGTTGGILAAGTDIVHLREWPGIVEARGDLQAAAATVVVACGAVATNCNRAKQ